MVHFTCQPISPRNGSDGVSISTDLDRARASPHQRQPLQEVFAGDIEPELAHCLIGRYFPSLPRVLEFHPAPAEGEAYWLLGAMDGEPLPEFIGRVGPLPVPVACALAARLAEELEALERSAPAVLDLLDPMASNVRVWQGEFLQLCIPNLQARKSHPVSSPIAARLLKASLCLLSGSADSLSAKIAAQLPTELLRQMRALGTPEEANLTIWNLRLALMDAVAARSRILRGSCMQTFLALQDAWTPVGHLDSPTARNRPGMARLSRFVAHRGCLQLGEISALMQKVDACLEFASQEMFALDPHNLWIQLPHQKRDSGGNGALDLRLDHFPNLSVRIDPYVASPYWASSPVMALEAGAPGEKFADVRKSLRWQKVRLDALLRHGIHGLKGPAASLVDGNVADGFQLSRAAITLS